MTHHDEERFHHLVLPSGITLVGEEVDSVRSLAVGVWARVGARHEAGNESGLSHFLEHMLFKGTTTRDAFQIAWSLEAVGGHLDAFTGREATCFYARALDEDLDLALDVLADLTLHPRFDPADVAKEKQVVLEEIHNSEDTPDDRIHELFADVVWKGHPLGHRILGSQESVSAFAPETVAGYHARNYVAPNLLLAIAGRFDWDHFVSEVAARFAGASPGAPSGTAPSGSSGRAVIHHVEDLQQQYLCIGGPGLPHEHPDRFTLALLSTVLGGGMSSRLFQRVREQEGLAYSVYTYADSYEDSGILCAAMNVQPAHGRKALRLTLEEFDRIAAEGLPPDELDAAKAQLKGGLLLSLESTSSRMHRIARSQLYAGRLVPVEELVASIEGIASEDVRRVAGTLLARERLSLVALGGSDERPFEESDLLAASAAT
ncbi:MAG TPA: pitrilysin family protein [Candidatus Eisenbacteria bacterium]|nr:pitrilysin family protein [Candidatus Eisenbacteria bacterium]